VDNEQFRVVRWLKRSQRGQALIEFALAAPLLVLMLLGLVEFGHALNSYLTVVAAARDAARLGAQIGVESDDQLAMRNVVSKEVERLENPVDTSVNCPGGSSYVCITSCEAPLGPGNCVDPAGQPPDKWLKVEVCYDHPTITHVPLLPDPMNMCSSTTIRIAK
jgi:hypothetical protein